MASVARERLASVVAAAATRRCPVLTALVAAHTSDAATGGAAVPDGYGGKDTHAAKELKELREQNIRLKRLPADA